MGFQLHVHVLKADVGQTVQADDASWLMILAAQPLMRVFPLQELFETILYRGVQRRINAQKTASVRVHNVGKEATSVVPQKKSVYRVIKHRKTLKKYPVDSCLICFEQPLIMV